MTAEVAKALADAGPWAVVCFLGGLALFSLWREHLKADLDDRQKRDQALDLLDKALDGNREAAAASKTMAAAWDERNRAEAARRRKADG